MKFRIKRLVSCFFEEWFLPVFVLSLFVGAPLLMYKAGSGMRLEKEKLVAEGYACLRGREAQGPTHARDSMYSCSKGSKTVTVGVFGKPVTGEYVLYN